MNAGQIEAQMRLCERDHAYAAKLGSRKVKSLVASYRKLHPGWTTGGQFDNDTYTLANRVMGVAQGVERAEKADRRMKRQRVH